MNHYTGVAHGCREDCLYCDTRWINKQLDQLPVLMQMKVKNRYGEIYDSLDGEHNQRFRTNSWLRKVIEKNRVIIDNNNLPF